MDTRKTMALSAGAGVAVCVAGVLAWRKSKKYRSKISKRILPYKLRFFDWKKEKIQDAYYASIDERDIAWG